MPSDEGWVFVRDVVRRCEHAGREAQKQSPLAAVGVQESAGTDPLPVVASPDTVNGTEMHFTTQSVVALATLQVPDGHTWRVASVLGRADRKDIPIF